MIHKDLKDKLTETIKICDIHFQRLLFAFQSVEKYFPLDETTLNGLSPIDLALFDQMVYRFSKLQDSMGNRLFRQILEVLEEDTENVPFIDILNRMEKLNLIENAKDWIILRQTRNTISHEYPFYAELQAEELNLLPANIDILSVIWNTLKTYTLRHILS
jgi:hypothetical protein